MMTAREARIIVEIGQEAKIKREMEKIEIAINEAVKRNFYNCSYGDYICPENRKKLTELGYGVGTTTTSRNEASTLISW